MGILRSEVMQRGTLVLPAERGRDFINLIGLHGNVEFVDMNATSLHRPYKRYIQRIEELERILRFLADECEHSDDAFLVAGRTDSFLRREHLYRLDDVEGQIMAVHDRYVKLKENNKAMLEKMANAIQDRWVLTTAASQMGMYGHNEVRLSTSCHDL